MTDLIGKTILHYQVIEQVGQGGMGVVYKAQDIKLERTVALKFLAANSLGGQAEKDRFKREARAAAALNHANIAHIYAIDEVDDQIFIAMEYIEGRELGQIISQSPLRLEDAIDYATQIAAGLQAAHEKGIVHRDIKSANIMVNEKGVVKIMDFGLAKLSGRSMMTQQGTTLGTISYMSPEQAQGQKVDHRSDIWSLGVVLYEMIAGQLPFQGDYEQAIIYAILNEEPEPLTALRTGLPIELDAIVSKAMAKDVHIRYQHVDELPADLKAVEKHSGSSSRISTYSRIAASPTRGPGAGAVSSRLPWAMFALATVVAVVMAFLWLTGKSPGDSSVKRFNIATVNSINQQILRIDIPTIAYSPDGRTLVYTLIEKGIPRLYRRTIDSFQASPISGGENATAPFFSPDGQWIGFLSDGKIKKVPLSGGAVETIGDAPGFRGASWGEGGQIVYSPAYGSGLLKVDALGGPPQPFSQLDSTRNERTHRWPQVLPGGEWVLFTIGDQRNPNSYVEAELAMQSLKTGERHILNVRGEMARYVEPGYLVVARNGVLMAAPFDWDEFKTTRPLTSVLEGVDGDAGSGISYFMIAPSGDLLYLPGIRDRHLELVWVNLQGTVTPVGIPQEPFNMPRISPDGTKISVTVGLVNGNNNDIWIYDLKTKVFNKFTFGNAMFDAVWSRDSQYLYYVSATGKQRGIVMKPVDGRSEGKLILANANPMFPISVAPGGDQMFINQLGSASEGEIYVLNLHKSDRPYALFQSQTYEFSGHLSPDGKYLTYGSNETGKLEIYVRSYPDLKGKWQLSTAGGFSPIWSPDGKALYYVSNVAKMMRIPIQLQPTFRAGKPQAIFDVSQMNFPNNPVHNYDISPDGKRFVMVKNVSFQSSGSTLNIITNWIQELKERVPRNGI